MEAGAHEVADMCMIDYCDERATVLHEQNRVARKQHKCSECQRQILTGEQYMHEAIVNDSSVDIFRTCEHCQVVREWLSEECGGWAYGGVEEDIREHFYEGYGLPVGRLAAGMSRHWRRRDGRLMPVPVCPPTSISNATEHMRDEA
jgi:hypothetical protein